MLSELRPAIFVTLLLTLITGIAYPLAMTAIAGLLFPAQANGSLVVKGDQIIGSELIGQDFKGPGYFHPRPSAAGNGYDATSSGGSNLGPIDERLLTRINDSVKELSGERPGALIPVDLVTTSGSGLDPHLSPEGADFQVPRVAAARQLSEADVRVLVQRNTEWRTLGVLGEPRVNVLRLNLALDALSPPR
jgi:K+-transporting ATPase ATPase C chain